MRKLLPAWFLSVASGLSLLTYNCLGAGTATPTSFTRLERLPAPKIVDSAAAYPGPYQPGNLMDGDRGTEYASNGKGTNTFIEFEFNEPSHLSGFRHVDRNDPATVAGSELIFMDEAGKVNS